MKHRRLALTGLLALAVTFGVTGAANATDDAPILKPVAGTLVCTAGGEGVEIKEGVVTIDGKKVASLSVTKAIPAMPGEPGEQGETAAVAPAVPLPPGEPGDFAGTVTVAPLPEGDAAALPAKPFPGKPGEVIEFGKTEAAIPAGEAGVEAAQPTSPEGPSFSSDGPEAPEGAKVVCVSRAVPAKPAAPKATD
ncbi:hypothetical protein [Herbidospora yilanensis]|uniref:hypothetical protein n=1 Tax=Herbidospora yilanensis TaxID=354426 RepID=UPI0012F8AEDF|nr:hypothetical protein [Herbidospora yilanensis]